MGFAQVVAGPGGLLGRVAGGVLLFRRRGDRRGQPADGLLTLDQRFEPIGQGGLALGRLRRVLADVADGLGCLVFQGLLPLRQAAGEGFGIVADVFDVARQAVKRSFGLVGAVAGLVEVAALDRVAGAGQRVDIDPAAAVLRQRFVERGRPAGGRRLPGRAACRPEP